MPADLLPGYRFERSPGRYRNESTGRFVARRDIVALLDHQVAATERRLAELVTSAHEGRLAPALFAEQLSNELRRLHSQNRALGAGGWDRMTPSDWGSVGRQLRDDYARVAQLAADIREGRVTLPQALNRVNGYAGNARRHFWQAERNAVQPTAGMVPIERRTLGESEHCTGCVTFYDQGWQPLGTMPEPGSGTPCAVRCKCTMHRREVPADEVNEWIGTKR